MAPLLSAKPVLCSG